MICMMYMFGVRSGIRMRIAAMTAILMSRSFFVLAIYPTPYSLFSIFLFSSPVGFTKRTMNRMMKENASRYAVEM